MCSLCRRGEIMHEVCYAQYVKKKKKYNYLLHNDLIQIA